MNGFFIASIVEGHGEQQALPVLLRRLHGESPAATLPLKVNPPIRVKAASFLSDGGYRSGYVQMAAAKARYSGMRALVLVLLDCEDGCPATDGPELLKAIARDVPDASLLVNFAYREFETWFMAAAASLGGVRGFPLHVPMPANPENKRDAKGWLSQHLGRRYNEPSDQPGFTSAFDLEAAARIASFARLRSKVAEFFEMES
jgi:Domain of unknown function (DUF4276)